MKELMRTFIQWGIALILLGSSGVHASGRKIVILPGIWGSTDKVYALAPARQEILKTKLRQITGWQELSFAANGQLEIGDPTAIEGGAQQARRVLLQALQCGKQFVIEDHSSSPHVSFGQLDAGTKYSDDRNGLRLEIYRVRLDFADFGKMTAVPRVRESFDEGFIFLHEILHGLGLQDTPIPNEIGECETVVNQIRAELGLPLRDQYLADMLLIARFIKTIRLRFREPVSDQQGIVRWKTRHLFFTPPISYEEDAATGASTVACLALH